MKPKLCNGVLAEANRIPAEQSTHRRESILIRARAGTLCHSAAKPFNGRKPRPRTAGTINARMMPALAVACAPMPP